MDYTFRRSYHGRVKAVIFDWAGTTVDYGCMAPAGAFVNLFKDRGVNITMEQARGPMGMHKRDHIRTITEMPGIAEAWTAANGSGPTEEDVESMFQTFVPSLIASIGDHTDVIDGTVDAVNKLRGRDIAIGSTTGYSVAIMEKVREAAAVQGYTPEVVVCADEVEHARPAPWMALQACMKLNVYPLEAVVKVGDTPADIAEGLNCGMWTVGVVRHGNEVGCDKVTISSMGDAAREAAFSRARGRLAESGAHFVAEAIAEVPDIVEEIEVRLKRGERP